jgi:hypothetical protein
VTRRGRALLRARCLFRLSFRMLPRRMGKQRMDALKYRDSPSPLTALRNAWIIRASPVIPPEETLSSEIAMPTGQPPCQRCQDNLFVRAEQIISGRRIMRAFYCGRCNHEWQIENAPPDVGERRSADRRTRQRDMAPPSKQLRAKLQPQREKRAG